MSDNAAESQVPSESTIDLSTTHIILLGLGGIFGLLLGVGVLALAYYCHKRNKLKDKEKVQQGIVLSCEECVGAATLTENIETAGTVVLDMDQIPTSSQHVHSSMIDDANILRHNRASSTKSPADSNNQVHFPLSNSVGSPFSVDYTAIDFPVDSSPNNSVDCPLNTSVDVPTPTITSVDSPSNKSVDFLPNTPVESAPNNSVDSSPNNSVHSSPNNSVHSPPNNSVDSPPNSSVHSIPNAPVESPTNNSLDCSPNNSVDSLRNTPVESAPNNSVDSFPNNSVHSSPNNSVHSPPSNSVDYPPNSSVHSFPNTPAESPQNNMVGFSPDVSVYSHPNNSVHSLPNTPVDSSPNNSVDTSPNNSVDSPPNTSVDNSNNSVHSFPNTPVDSPPNNSVHSSPKNPVDSPPNTSVDNSPNNSVHSFPNTPVDSPPNNSMDTSPNNSIDSPPDTWIDSPNNMVHSFPNTPVDSSPNNSVDSPPINSVDSSPNNSVDSSPNNAVDSSPNTSLDSPNNSVHSFPNIPLDSSSNNSVDSPQNNSVDSPINSRLDTPQNNSVESPGDISHPEAMSPNIFNQTSTGGTTPLHQCTSDASSGSPQTSSFRHCSQDCETVAVSPRNLEEVEAIEMPEPNFVLPNREVCQEGYLSATKDQATPYKEDGYIKELKGDGDLVCQDTISKNNLVGKDTVKEMNVLSELQILQEKVRALEQQNAVLIKAHTHSEIHGDEKEKTKDKDAHSRALNDGLNSSVGSFKIEDIKLIDVDSLEREGGTWLMTVNKGQVKEGLEIPVGEFKGQTPIAGSPMEGMEWLRRESGVSQDLAASRNTLVNRLNGMTNAFMLPAWIQGDSNSDLSQAADLLRWMPNVTKSACRGAARPQYSLSQNSQTRLQGPSHLQAPESQEVKRGTMHAPTCPPNSRGRPASGGRKLHSGPRPSSEGLARKSSLPARPTGTSMPSSTGSNINNRSSSTKLPSGTRPSSNGQSGTSGSSSTKLPSGTRPSSNGQSGTSRQSSTKLSSSNGPSGTSRSSSTKLPSGIRPSSNGQSGTSKSSNTKLPAPSARRGLARGNIGGTRVS